MSLSHQMYASQISKGQLPPYPSDSFPPVLRNIIEALHAETQFPKELIGNIVLAAASLACQSLVNVISPHSGLPEQCSLYLMTIAESGEGKTTINKQIMKPFYDFSSEMIDDYEEKMKTYKREHDIWKVKKQGLDSNLRQAIRKGYSGEMEEDAIKNLALNEPHCPSRPNLVYEDVTYKALIEGLSEQPEAGIISDEAITFFKGYLKNNPGLLNKGWDGEAFDFSRPDGKVYRINPCLTFSLMSQPKVFIDYINKNETSARGSGFLSRFLFSWVNTSIGQRNDGINRSTKGNELELLHERINELLEKVKRKLKYNDSKKTLTLKDEAISSWKEKCSEIERKMAANNDWEHIRDIGAKSGANILRIAAILQSFYKDEHNQIGDININHACIIMDWYLQQASNIFHPFSERYQFELDVRELYSWICNRIDKSGQFHIPKNELEKYGPHRLRRTDKLTPVLNQLISQGIFMIVRSHANSALYIYHNIYISSPLPHNILLDRNFILIQTKLDTKGRYEQVDLSGL